MKFGISLLTMLGILILSAFLGLTLGVVRMLWVRQYRGTKLLRGIGAFFVMLYASLFSNGIRAKKKSSKKKGLASVFVFIHMFAALFACSVTNFPETFLRITTIVEDHEQSAISVARSKIKEFKEEVI